MGNRLKLYIDASALYYSGGGSTHLINFLTINNFDEFTDVRVFGSKHLNSTLPKKKNIIYISNILLNYGLLPRLIWIFLIFNPSLFFKRNVIILNLSSNIIFNSRTITVSHNLIPFDESSLIESKFKLKLRILILRYYQLLSFYFSKKIVFVSNTLLNEVSKYYSSIRDKSSVIYNAHFSLLNEREVSKNVSNIFYVSSSHPYKNQLNVIKAFELIYHKKKDVSLFLIGEYTNNYGLQLINYIEKSDSKKNIFLYPTLTSENLFKLYEKCDIFISASSCESFGINVLDAMSQKIPVVCSDIPTYKEIFTNNVFYFDPKDFMSIHNSLLELINNYSLRKSYSNKGYLHSLNFSWQKSINELYKILLNVR